MVEFLCLANSWKDGERCVAGLVPGRGWVRPVPDRTGSAVPQRQVSHIGLLDVVDIDLGKWVPITGQPENWLIGPAGFSRNLGKIPSRLQEELEGIIEQEPELLKHGDRKKISPQNMVGKRTPSLALIEPSYVQWHIRPDMKKRCQFEIGRSIFELPVTDIDVWRALNGLAPGRYDRSVAGIPDNQRLLLTISLTGKFKDGYYYKLVAAAIELPA